MTDTRILVVEDEPMVAEVVERYLRKDGYAVRSERDGARALDAYRAFQPDLIVLDLMLPGIDGLEVCRRVRADSRTPIIMLTAKGEEVDKLIGLEVGADDYVTKPFSPRELAARVKAVLRRTGDQNQVDAEALRFNGLRINGRTRSVENGGTEIRLTAREFDLLFFLASHPNQVFTRDQLLDSVYRTLLRSRRMGTRCDIVDTGRLDLHPGRASSSRHGVIRVSPTSLQAGRR